MPTEYVTARECAERWGLSYGHVRRVLANVEPAGGRDTHTGAMLYRLTEAEAARADRPGPGARTDLYRQE